MHDQAHILRELMEQRRTTLTAELEAVRSDVGRIRTLSIASGKGGVGKTSIALSLAIALAQLEMRVCLLDANPGLGNLDLLCRLNGYWNLSHVVSGARTVKEVTLSGPAGVNVLSGGQSLGALGDCSHAAQCDIRAQLRELEMSHDFLIIDTPSAVRRTGRRFLTAADAVLLVTTPEPTAVADAYATVKALAAERLGQPEVLVNQAETPQQAHAVLAGLRQTARLLLHCDITSAGHIPHDPYVARSVAARRPFLIESPHCPASRAVKQLAARVKNLCDSRCREGTFFPRLWEDPLCQTS